MTPSVVIPPVHKSLDEAKLQALCFLPGPWCTVLLPAYRPGEPGANDSVRLKHLLRPAAELPETRKLGDNAESLLGPLRELAESGEIGPGGKGLALMSAPGFCAGYRLNARVEQKLVIAKHPFIRPLLAEALAAQEVFALGLSRKLPHLYRCRHGECEELPLPAGVPRGLGEAGAFDQPDHTLANRSAVGTSAGNMHAMRFGTSSDREAAPEYLHHYFQLVDRGLQPVIREAPLFLMGIGEEIAAYRKAAQHSNLLATEWEGNADLCAAGEIAERERAAVLEQYRRRGESALAEFREMTDHLRTRSGVAGVAAAATQGRIHKLLLAEDVAIPAEHASHRLELLKGEDVLNAVAVETIRKGGQVFALSAKTMGDAAPLAAILRY